MILSVRRRLPRASTLAILAVLTASACRQPEHILPGPRYDLRDLSDAQSILSRTNPVPDQPTPPQPPRQIGNPPYAVTGKATKLSLPAAKAVSSWPVEGQNAQHLTPNAALHTGALSQAWSVQIGMGNAKRSRMPSGPIAAAGRIFTVDANNTVSAVSPAGQVLWHADLTPPDVVPGAVTGGGLAYADGKLFVTTGFGALIALDASSGQQLWIKKFDAPITAAPMVDGNLVYVVSRDGYGWAISTSNGKMLWEIEGTAATAGNLGAGAPAIAGKAVLFPFDSGEVDAVLRLGGISLWSASIAGERTGSARGGEVNGIIGGPVISGSTAYIATGAGRLAAVDTDSGARLWTATEGGMGPVTVAGGSLFLVSDQGLMMRLNASDGSTVWSAPLPLYVNPKVAAREDIYVHYGPILAGGRLIVASTDGLLREIDPTSGTLLRTTSLGAPAAAAPIVVDGTLYVLTADGQLRAFR